MPTDSRTVTDCYNLLSMLTHFTPPKSSPFLPSTWHGRSCSTPGTARSSLLRSHGVDGGPPGSSSAAVPGATKGFLLRTRPKGLEWKTWPTQADATCLGLATYTWQRPGPVGDAKVGEIWSQTGRAFGFCILISIVWV